MGTRDDLANQETRVALQTGPLTGQKLAGRYRVAGLLGSGGVGTVYRAVQEPLGRHVALKVIDPRGRRETVARFQREARALAGLSHPNVVGVLDVGEVDGLLYLAMELVEGGSLRTLMAETGPLATGVALEIAADIARGLGALHDRGIVHRDLRPENVMIGTAFGRERIAKLVDFGLARAHDDDDEQQVTRVGQIVGTPMYLAPESMRGGLDARADLYALGVVLYEMITGRRPFDDRLADNLVALMAKKSKPVLALPPHVPGPVAAIALRSMAPAPEQRPQSAAELLALLEAARGEPSTLPEVTDSSSGVFATAATQALVRAGADADALSDPTAPTALAEPPTVSLEPLQRDKWSDDTGATRMAEIVPVVPMGADALAARGAVEDVAVDRATPRTPAAPKRTRAPAIVALAIVALALGAALFVYAK